MPDNRITEVKVSALARKLYPSNFEQQKSFIGGYRRALVDMKEERETNKKVIEVFKKFVEDIHKVIFPGNTQVNTKNIEEKIKSVNWLEKTEEKTS